MNFGTINISGGVFNGNGAFGGNQVRGSGKVVEEQREIAEHFDQVALNGSVDVEVVAGKSTTGVKVQADDNILALVKTRVEDGVLHVNTEGSYSTQNGPKVLVELDHSLVGAALNGSGDLKISGQIGDRFAASLMGSGDLSMSGHVASLELSSMGSGDFNGRGLVADQASLRCMGSGDATVHADRSLNVQLMGSGDCYYSGSPRVTKSILGSGELEQL
ncbi:DUF2807 domain-containing protein [bacterium]|nr:DUF2807 domain-containing protein [bacterium]